MKRCSEVNTRVRFSMETREALKVILFHDMYGFHPGLNFAAIFYDFTIMSFTYIGSRMNAVVLLSRSISCLLCSDIHSPTFTHGKV